jgi:prepilin-type N-terminal cleavage/methylation domain-containing protein
MHPPKAFTLIELLVVIAVIAILSVVVILSLNPAELLRQSRDSTRLSDMATIQSAINMYNADQSGAASYSLGSSNVTYVSIPDPTATTTAGTDCSGIGFPAGGAFHCAAPSSFRTTNGTGWIPINFSNISSGVPFGNLPVDPVNTTSSNEYYTYQTNGTTFKIRSVPESAKYLATAGTNPNLFTAGSNPNLGGGTGWVLVPGNRTYGTQNFYAMKYDAVCSNGNGTVVNTPADGDGYNNGTTACTPANNLQIAAFPGGYPIVDISHTSSTLYCQSIGAHLLTNDEYMTIVTNAANQASNWTGGSVGSGGLYLGNASNGTAYPADPNDANGYSNGTGGTMAGQTITYTGDERRTFTLSNGAVIWDMSGNVWEHVQRSVNNQGDLTTSMALPACSNGTSTWESCQYGNSTTPYISAYSTNVTQLMVAPPNASWNSSQDIGQVYTDAGGSGSIFIRGGDWGGSSSDGAFAVNLYWGAGSTLNNVGFRCAR